MKETCRRLQLWLLACLAVALWSPAASAEDVELTRVFARHHARGTFVLSSLDGRTTFIHDDARARRRLTPASTFKIANSLIALEEGVIDEKRVMKWDGSEQPLPEWNRDHTLESAFRVSCVWCYQRLARRIGAGKYRDYLSRFKYGNGSVGVEVAQFWLDGSLRISALEQVAFLRAVVARKLPLKPSTYETLARIMVLARGPTYVLRGKTGTSMETKPALGWLVGEVATGAEHWLFAMNLDLGAQADRAHRLALAREALRAKHILP